MGMELDRLGLVLADFTDHGEPGAIIMTPSELDRLMGEGGQDGLDYRTEGGVETGHRRRLYAFGVPVWQSLDIGGPAVVSRRAFDLLLRVEILNGRLSDRGSRWSVGRFEGSPLIW